MRTINKEYVLKMKNSAGAKNPAYYKYCTAPAGSSDIASLLFRTGNRETGEIPFGEDDSYQAHLIVGDTEVPEHYQKNKILDTDAPGSGSTTTTERAWIWRMTPVLKSTSREGWACSSDSRVAKRRRKH